VAKRLYRFLEKRCHFHPRGSFDLKDLAREHIGLSRSHDAANLKRRLWPGIAELERKGFLQPLRQPSGFGNSVPAPCRWCLAPRGRRRGSPVVNEITLLHRRWVAGLPGEGRACASIHQTNARHRWESRCLRFPGGSAPSVAGNRRWGSRSGHTRRDDAVLGPPFPGHQAPYGTPRRMAKSSADCSAPAWLPEMF
jgi:hypothetical protein